MKLSVTHIRALAGLGAVTLLSNISFVHFKASVMQEAPLVAGESSWFIAAHNLAPRFLIGALCLIAFYGVRVVQLTRTEWTQAIFMALTSFSGCMLQTDGLQRTTAATTAFLTQFYVILIPLWWALVHRKRPTSTVLWAGLLVLVGMAVLARVDWREFHIGRGEGEVLAAAVFFSLLLCSLNWPAFASNRAERTSTGMFLIQGPLLALLAALTCREPVHLISTFASPAWVCLTVVAAVMGTAAPFVLMNYWQRFIPTTEAGLLYSFGPVIAALTELFMPALYSRWVGIDYPNQPVTLTLVAGGALILAANLLIQLWPQEKV